MLIGNFINFTPQINGSCNVSAPFNHAKISFAGQVNQDTADFSFSKGLSKLKDFSIEEYNTLTECELKALRAATKKHLPIDDWITNHDMVSDNIKNYLDLKYGENGYKVLIIGRSLSSIGKVLGYKIGEDNVVNIPMSSAGKYNRRKAINYMEKYGEINLFKDFLEGQGLTKEELNSGKQYVIMDYCHTGESLKGAKRILTRDCLLGKKNVHSLDVMDCIPDKKFAKEMEDVLYRQLYKGFSFVQKALFLHNAADSIIDTTKADMVTKLGWFGLLDSYMTKPIQENKSISKVPKTVHIRNTLRKILLNLNII